MILDQIQKLLRDQKLDGWLFFDHHHRDPLAYRVLGLPPGQHVTRRWYYFIPAHGEPAKLVHRIESRTLDSLPGTAILYSSWNEQTAGLASLLRGNQTVAMQYSPNCSIPYVSMVDGGTVDLVRSVGIEVVTSAELIQHFEARLNEEGLRTHLLAGELVDSARAAAFQRVAEELAHDRGLTEFELAEFIRARFQENGLVTDSGPIVAVNAHAGDPHYEPLREGSTQICRGDFVLLDMWAKLDVPGAVYYDITWTGFCGTSIPEEFQRVFSVVRDARDAAIAAVHSAITKNVVLRGFEVDDAARNVIRHAGFGDRFIHRTGHSIGVEVHGNGANMDNLETHDDRVVIPWSCFSIEPGIYLDHFGVRSEVDIFVDDKTARVTGEVQHALVVVN